MSAELNHTIVWCRNQKESAEFLAEVLGRPAPTRFGPFHVVALDNRASLDFHQIEGEIAMQHYAFLIGEEDFDTVLHRVKARGLTYWADPARTRPAETYRHNGGRGFYFNDSNGHLLEVHTRPYASGSFD